ncbi:MAG: SCP2 sterol-binding domain-containing protein [Methylotenera sp.]|nr:SCP2 sterol-binding domain-containing protein [Methylotenera sp.]
MLKPLITRFLQHITQQNSWSRSYLTPFSGRILQFNFSLLKANLIILEDGSLSLAAETAKADAIIHVPPSLAMRLIAQDESAKMQIKIDGDTHLATEFSKVLQQMRWDYEEDLSHLVGDIAANKLVTGGKKIAQETKKQSINLAEMLSEYWQEEKPTIAKKWQVEKFVQEVDSLKSDMARFEKKLKKFSKSVNDSAESLSD